MIRLACIEDIPQIAEGLFQLVDTTGWSLFSVRPTYGELHSFLLNKLVSPDDLMEVWVENGVVEAFCGGTMGQFYAPPNEVTVYEWGWYGPPKKAAKLWHSLLQWGLRRGAVLAGRATIEQTNSRTHIIERITWTRIAR